MNKRENVIYGLEQIARMKCDMDRYPSIVFMILLLIFFFNKKIVCMLFISVFIASILNSIMKYTIYFLFEGLNLPFSICYLALVTEQCLISLIKSSQS